MNIFTLITCSIDMCDTTIYQCALSQVDGVK